MKKIILLVTLFFGFAGATAQSFEEYKKQANKEFNSYREDQVRAFKEYRDKVNSEYADYMRKAWKSFEIEDAIEIIELPEPPEPIVRDPLDKVSADPIRFKEVILPPVPRPEPPKPVIPIDILDDEEEEDIDIEDDSQKEIIPPLPLPDPEPLPEPDPKPAPDPVIDEKKDEPAPKPEPDPIIDEKKDEPAPKPEPKPKPIDKKFSFNLYGTNCSVSLDNTHRFKLNGVDENAVANAWELLSTDKYNKVVADALTIRNNLKLSDWAYFRMLEEMTTSFLGVNAPNEARLLQIFILVQSGYNVRIARADSHLAVLLPFDDAICQYKYFTLDNMKYYIVDRTSEHSNYYIFNRKFPKEQILSIGINDSPEFNKNMTSPKSFKVNQISVSTSLNKNLMDFYSDYPRSSSWIQYSKASLSDELKEALYPKLRASIAGLNEVEATQQLLSFVQKAFSYKTDQDQFGYERPLFCDETFFYPFSDCEDRSILFAALVRELIGLDVVLLYYNDGPSSQHLATAVKFNSDIKGDYFNLSNQKYIICDPTYIGASIGMAMPQFKTSSATIYYY